MSDRAYWLAWSRVSGIGSTITARFKQRFGSLQAAWQASSSELFSVEGVGPHILESILSVRQHLDPEDFLQKHQKTNPFFWTPEDFDYPRLLLETSSHPLILYYRGQVNREENHGLNSMVAIVGTRDPSDYAKRWTNKLTITLVQHGFTVVSGLADGIDTEAHRSCIATNGRTIAVLGTGVDVVYPRRNWNLYHDIVKQGLIVSEYPQGTQPDRGHFPKRNRIIAGLSRAVIVTEAPTRSGALITANIASDFGRDVYVLPGSLDNYRAIGCLDLINKGAQVILSESHLIELLGTMPRLDTPALPPPPVDLPPVLAKTLQVITLEPLSIDQIVHQAGSATHDVSSALVQLELMGLITQLPGMRYQRY